MPQRHLITVCQGRSCVRSGAGQVLAEFQQYGSDRLMVSGCECQGQCASGPTVRVMPDDTWYCQIKPEDVAPIVHEHCEGGAPVQRLLHPRLHPSVDTYANLAAQYAAQYEAFTAGELD